MEYKLDSGLHFLIDKNKFEKVLNNLTSNALKFTPKYGEIKIVLEDIGHALQLQVADTGSGIHPDELPYIFDRFYQSKHKSTFVPRGTGIGLALVNEYVKLLKGNIKVESKLGIGSTFYIEFPKKEVLQTLSVEEIQAIQKVEDSILNNQLIEDKKKLEKNSCPYF